MGLIGKIAGSEIDEELREIQTEVYTDVIKTSRQVSPPGVDSSPIEDDQGVLIMLDEAEGKTAQLGVYPTAEVDPGNVRIYSRDESGETKAQVFVKSDGEIEVVNDESSVVIKSSGDIEIKGKSIKIEGNDITMLGGGSSFVKGEDLENLLSALLNDGWMNSPTAPAFAPAGPNPNGITLAVLQAAAKTAKAQIAQIKSQKIKGE